MFMNLTMLTVYKSGFGDDVGRVSVSLHQWVGYVASKVFLVDQVRGVHLQKTRCSKIL